MYTRGSYVISVSSRHEKFTDTKEQNCNVVSRISSSFINYDTFFHVKVLDGTGVLCG
jgi:hypothetical protein